MHTRKLLLYLTLLLSFNVLVSCDKDKEEPEPEVTNRELLIADEWRGDRALINGVNIALIPGVGARAQTFNSLVLKFMDDNTYLATYLNEGQQESFRGGWQLNADQTKLTLDMLGEMEIDKLTTTNLDVTSNISTDNIALLAEVFGVDATLINIITGGGNVNAKLQFVRD
ncbi:hypothetical protein [Pontibacter akesuensis]|uniref:Lipocalin-like domain-containing protein n=1 Tax=Pontibacter akesuensis TaxID=388950 RepID=A0A1I7FNP1_9BACT|nr:hypothetical protein [Pontibacter akesuensis]GHA61272.1 hypothetical protein GCM10007389_12100 [Pontibacter akesuensis]SFU37827.1 hypothetical protein SAMN04487941_0352 [Pontibacter akesuensis]